MYMFSLKQIHSLVPHIVKVVMRIILTEIENISSKRHLHNEKNESLPARSVHTCSFLHRL